MSLSSVVKRKEIREEMRKHIHFPILSNPDAPIFVEATHNRAALTGQAFDYALRVIIQTKFPQSKSYMWVAQQAVVAAKAVGEVPLDTIDLMVEIIEEARKVFALRKFSDQFAIACLNLANMDIYIRTGSMPKNIPYMPMRAEIDDLTALCRLAVKSFPFPVSSCILNPTFGNAARLFGGADADLIVDSTLIDIKTTKNLFRYQDHIFQLVGYIICHEIDGGVGSNKNVPLDRAGFYFSRHGLLETWKISDLIDHDGIEELADFFRGHLSKEKVVQYDF